MLLTIFSLWYDYHLYVCNHEKEIVTVYIFSNYSSYFFTLIAIATG